MKLVVFYGNTRKGNTRHATGIFLDELRKISSDDVEISEFFMPSAIPVFCTGCQTCLGNPREKCPHASSVNPIYKAIMEADGLVFSTPHCGGSSIPASMKNLLDHLDFFTMTVSPRKKLFDKKAFVLTTGSGSASGIKLVKNDLKHWGINRVDALGIRMFTDKWMNMSEKRRKKCEKRIRKSAEVFYRKKKGLPYPSTLLMYYLNRFIIRKFVGKGNYPYEYWKEHGYFEKCPFF